LSTSTEQVQLVKASFPLWVKTTKKKTVPVSVTWYRNAHFQELNKVKKMYAEELAERQLKNYSPMVTPVFVLFILFVRDKSRLDLDNYTGTHKKFFMDSLVTHKIIVDDTVFEAPLSIEVFGGIDKNNPRVDVYVSQDLNLIGKLARKFLWLKP